MSCRSCCWADAAKDEAGGSLRATLASSANVTVGQDVTLVARIDGLSPTGSVTFSDSSTVLGSVTVSAGAASFSLASLTQGSHSLSAVYSGDVEPVDHIPVLRPKP